MTFTSSSDIDYNNDDDNENDDVDGEIYSIEEEEEDDDDDINNFKQIGDLGIDIEFRMLPRDKKKQLSDLIK